MQTTNGRRLRNNGLQPVNQNPDYQEKIRKYRRRKRITTVLIVLLLLLLIAAGMVLYYYHTYEGYVVKETQEHSDSTYVSYEMIHDLRLRCTKDGISLLENDNQTVWSATYEMQSPVTDICGDYIIVYEKGGNRIYLFDTKEALYTYDSAMPIKMACVSSKGTIAMMLEEEDQVCRMKYVDSKGETIAEGRSFFSERGYPMDMSLSYDGYQLCVSYYVIEGAAAKTNLIFYSFDEIGDANVDHIVTQDSYSDTIIPTVKFLKDGTLAAFSDNSVLIYSGGKKPALANTVEISDEILSVAYDEKNFAVVTAKENGKKQLQIYNHSGKPVSTIPVDFEYTDIRMKDGVILLYNTAKWNIYLKNGYRKATGEYDGEITQMVPAGFQHYMIVGSDKIEEIQLAN